MAVETRDAGFEQVRPAAGAAMVHRFLDGEPAGNGIVAVDRFTWNAERLAAIDDALHRLLRAVAGGYAPAVVHDDHEDR